MTSKPRKRDAPPGPGRKEQGNEAQQDAAQNRGPAFHVGCRLMLCSIRATPIVKFVIARQLHVCNVSPST